MARARRKSRAKRRWYTYAYLTREGIPHPGHHNFVQHYGTTDVMLEDLGRGMKLGFGKGAYVIAIWPGQLGEWEAMHGAAKPLYYVYEDGVAQKL